MEVEDKIAAPLSAKEHRFVDAYISFRDVQKAAVEAGFTAKEGSGLYRRKAVHAEITRRMENVSGEVDKIIAKKRVINVEMLDQNLRQLITIPKASIKETPSLATPKLNAIELGFKRVGLLLDGNFVPDAASGPSQEEAPRIYRSSEQTIITHQITETRKVVTERQHGPVDVHPAPSPAPMTIDAELDPWANF